MLQGLSELQIVLSGLLLWLEKRLMRTILRQTGAAGQLEPRVAQDLSRRLRQGQRSVPQ